MTAQIIEGIEVTRPDVEPITSTILDHFPLVINSKFGLRNNEGVWDSYNCLDLLVPTPTCANPLVEMDYKDFKFAAWVPAYEFAVHGGVQCLAVGLDLADQRAEIERVFGLTEHRGIEQSLLYNRFEDHPADVGSDAVVNPYDAEWDAPTDITPASAVSLIVAVAMLEGHAAANYAGLPVLHLPRAAATILEGAGVLRWEGNKAYTKNGSRIVMGGGYDDPTMLASGEWDLFATGEIHIEATDLGGPFQQHVIPGDGSGVGSDENGLSDNTVVTLVERQYRVTVDCYVAKITATVFSA